MDELKTVEEKLNKKGIYDVRQIARALNVHPEFPQKPKIIETILQYARGEINPAPPSLRGAPPKSYDHDAELVAEIEALRRGAPTASSVGVSDGEDETVAKISGVFCVDGTEKTVLCGDCKAAVAPSALLRYELRAGDLVEGTATVSKDGKRDIFKIESINGSHPDDMRGRRNFSDLTHIYPDKKLTLSDGNAALLCRETDLFCPLGFGERVVVTGADNAVCIEALKTVAHAICGNYRDLDVVFLLVDARPEDATYFKRAFGTRTVFCSTFEKSAAEGYRTAVNAFEHCKRLLELNKNAVLLCDGLFNGYIDKELIKRLFYSACNAEEGGSLTVISTMPDGYPHRAEMTGIAGAVIALDPAAAKSEPSLDIKASRSDRERSYLGADESAAAAAIRFKLTNGETAALFGSVENNGLITEKYKNG